MALIGPYGSRAVAETVEATAPAGLPLLAPVATWAGVTRTDEPGCEDDPADHRGTVFRLVARDTEVTRRLADEVRRERRRALVVASEHEYGVQLDGQLRLCGLAGEAAIESARELAPLPVIAFDGVQGADLGAGREVLLALPFAPSTDLPSGDLFAGVGRARRAAELVVDLLAAGAADRGSVLAGLRESGQFDEHGDPVEPDVWLWRADDGWRLEPERVLPS